MKKYILIVIILISSISFAEINLIEFKELELGNWQELNFNGNKNVYWFEVDAKESLKYTLSVSGVYSKIYGTPSLSPVIYIYNKNMKEIIDYSMNERPILLELEDEADKLYIQVISIGEFGNAYINIGKINQKKKRKREYNLEIQKFNENPYKK